MSRNTRSSRIKKEIGFDSRNDGDVDTDMEGNGNHQESVHRLRDGGSYGSLSPGTCNRIHSQFTCYDQTNQDTLDTLEADIEQRQQDQDPNPVFDESGKAMKDLGKEVAAIAAVMEKLRALGIDHTYGVPELCVVGLVKT